MAITHVNAAVRSDKNRIARGLSPYDGWQGQATRSQAAPGQWRGEGGLQKTMQFNIDDIGDETATMLAVSWCHRMQYFYNAHLEGVLGTPEMVANCVEEFAPPYDSRAFSATAQGRDRAEAERVLSVVPQ